MKKYFLIFAFIALTPLIASAAWWNPLSWGIFSPASISVQTQSTSTASTTEAIFSDHSPTVSTTTIVTVSTSTTASSTHFVATHKNIVKKYVPVSITAATSSVQVQNQATIITPPTSVVSFLCMPGYVYFTGLGCMLVSQISTTSSSSIFGGVIYNSPEQAQIAAKNTSVASTSPSVTPNYAAGQGYSGMVPLSNPCDSAPLYNSSSNCTETPETSAACQQAENDYQYALNQFNTFNNSDPYSDADNPTEALLSSGRGQILGNQLFGELQGLANNVQAAAEEEQVDCQ